MSEKTFWGAVGGIVVVVLVCFYFLVWDNYSQYQEKSQELSRKVKNMEKLSNRPVEELPTKELRDAHVERAEKWQSNVEAANEFFKERDSRMESWIGNLNDPGVAQWEAVYRDEFKRLSDAYRKKTGLPEEEDLPFPEFGDLEDARLADYQREWRVQHELITAILDIDRAEIIKFKKGRTQDIDAAMPLADFNRIRFQLRGGPARHADTGFPGSGAEEPRYQPRHGQDDRQEGPRSAPGERGDGTAQGVFAAARAQRPHHSHRGRSGLEPAAGRRSPGILGDGGPDAEHRQDRHHRGRRRRPRGHHLCPHPEGRGAAQRGEDSRRSSRHRRKAR